MFPLGGNRWGIGLTLDRLAPPKVQAVNSTP